MYQHRTSIAVFVLAFFALLGVASAPARADRAISQSVSVLGQFFYDDCTGEYVTLSGYAHSMTKVTTNQNGTIIYRTDINFQDVHGVGDVSGLKYVISYNAKFTQTAAPGSYSYSEMSMARVLSQGSAENRYTSVRFGFTYDVATDTYTATIDQFSDTCRG